MSTGKKTTVNEESSFEAEMSQLNPAAVEAEPENKNLPSGPATAPTLEEVAVADLICDEHTQVRAAENEEAIENYAEAMNSGAKFPPPIVFRDDDAKLWVSEGHHTVKAYVRRGVERITVDLRVGTAKDARMHAYTSNLTHGVQLTNADKRKIVEGLIKDTKWKDRKIAEHIRFWSHEKVRGIRLEMAGKTWKKETATPIENPESEGDAGFVNVAEAIDINKLAEEEGEVTLDDVEAQNDSQPSEALKWQKHKPGPAMGDAKLSEIAKDVVAEAESSGFSFSADDKTQTVTVAVKRGAVVTAYHCQVLMEAVVR